MLSKTLRAISYIIISLITILMLVVVYYWVEGKYTYWRYYSHKPIKERATMLVKVFNSKAVEDFKGWDYHRRDVYMFVRDTDDKSKYYTILYSDLTDTLGLQIVSKSCFESFNKEFSTHIKRDTTISGVELFEYNDTVVNVAYRLRGIRDSIYNEHNATKQLFPDKNPFTYFSNLVKIIKKGKIISVYHDEGNLCLIMSDRYILYHMPNLQDDRKRKDFLKRTYREYDSIEPIAKDWYLVKLAEPLDFG